MSNSPIYSPAMNSTLSPDRQVTIPEAVCEALGLEPGMDIEFQAKEGLLVGRRQLNVEALLAKWRGRSTGVVEKFGGVDAYLRMTRGRDDDGA